MAGQKHVHDRLRRAMLGQDAWVRRKKGRITFPPFAPKFAAFPPFAGGGVQIPLTL
jgi:hypothetical protein